MHESHKANVVNTELATMALLTGSAIEEALRICHKGAEGHGRMRRTYMTLCKTYPGHQIPQKLDVATHTAMDVARSLYAFRCTYGHYETVASDPGCDLTAEGVQQYLQWAGQTHRTSLVDRHQSNGVEVINRHIMVLLRALVCDRHIQNNWSEIQNIGTVQFIINQHISTETKSSAFSLKFGDLDEVYMKLPEDTDANLTGDEYVELLKVNLTSLRATAASCIASNEYKHTGTMTEEKQNIYLDGDLVLYDLRGPDKEFLPSKLTTP
jgi:hypothetical protein